MTTTSGGRFSECFEPQCRKLMRLTPRRFRTISTLLAVLLTAAVWVAYWAWGEDVVEAAFHGKSFDLANRLLTARRNQDPARNLAFYTQKTQAIVARSTVAIFAGWLLAVGGSYVRVVRSAPLRLFHEPVSPVDLAVFRIALFGYMLWRFDAAYLFSFAKLPADLQSPPIGSAWMYDLLPISTATLPGLIVAFQVACWCSMLGLFCRWSTVAATLLGVYVLGVPQCYGKVDHFHHLLWFSAILATSRPADVLALDAIRYSWRRADHGRIEPPNAAVAYAIPLRFVWLLIGIVYFFPGLWKLLDSGMAWWASDNVKLLLYRKWSELGGWLPLFRLDAYPLLYRAGGLAVILFELGFVFLIFFPRLRPLIVAGGVGFHLANEFLLRISFRSLLICYTAFVPWSRLFRRMGEWLFPRPLWVVYDGNCRLCRRTLATFGAFDVLHRYRTVPSGDWELLGKQCLSWLESNALRHELHAVIGARTWGGFDAVRKMASRMPLFWVLLPVLYVWPVTYVGRRFYRHVADGRTCASASDAWEPLPSTLRGATAVVMMGAALCGLNSACGFATLVPAWPFACYPTFSGLAPDTVEVIEVFVVTPSGEELPLPRLAGRLNPARRRALQSQILHSTDAHRRESRLVSLWQAAVARDKDLQKASRVRFYRTVRSTDPADREEPPIERSLLLEWDARQTRGPDQAGPGSS